MTALLPLISAGSSVLGELGQRQAAPTGGSAGFAALLHPAEAAAISRELHNPNDAVSFDAGLLESATPTANGAVSLPRMGTSQAKLAMVVRQSEAAKLSDGRGITVSGMAASGTPTSALPSDSVKMSGDTLGIDHPEALFSQPQRPSLAPNQMRAGAAPTVAVQITRGTALAISNSSMQPGTILSLTRNAKDDTPSIEGQDGPSYPYQKTIDQASEETRQVNLAYSEDGLVVSFIEHGAQSISIGQLQAIAMRILTEFNVSSASLAYKAARMPIGKQKFQGGSHGNGTR